MYNIRNQYFIKLNWIFRFLFNFIYCSLWCNFMPATSLLTAAHMYKVHTHASKTTNINTFIHNIWSCQYTRMHAELSISRFYWDAQKCWSTWNGSNLRISWNYSSSDTNVTCGMLNSTYTYIYLGCVMIVCVCVRLCVFLVAPKNSDINCDVNQKRLFLFVFGTASM